MNRTAPDYSIGCRKEGSCGNLGLGSVPSLWTSNPGAEKRGCHWVRQTVSAQLSCAPICAHMPLQYLLKTSLWNRLTDVGNAANRCAPGATACIQNKPHTHKPASYTNTYKYNVHTYIYNMLYNILYNFSYKSSIHRYVACYIIVVYCGHSATWMPFAGLDTFGYFRCQPWAL